jgi:hypothetical protein
MRSRLPAPVGVIALLLAARAGRSSPGSGPPVASAAAPGAPRADLTVCGAASLQRVLLNQSS